jgi:hypothetical protein
VNEKPTSGTPDGESCSSARQYSTGQAIINNIPYIAMTILGAAVFAVSIDRSPWGLIAAAYLAYGAVGAFWIMVFVCPYCRYWNSSSCPCGYGLLAAKFRKKSTVECFDKRFRKHIPVIVPLWFLPLLAGLPQIIRSFSWPLLVLLVLFAVDAFAVLPLVSTKHGCKECPQKDSCPWITIKTRLAG